MPIIPIVFLIPAGTAHDVPVLPATLVTIALVVLAYFLGKWAVWPRKKA
jgi:hypothetical protein